MATIKDVAKLAGVSISTVSIMINGNPNISTDKYNRILAAMKELKYHPSVIARSLKKQNFHFIGVVFPNFEGHYANILKGIQIILDEEKYYIIIKSSDDDINKEDIIIENLLALGVSGIICVPCDPTNIQKYQQWTEAGISTVFLERKIESLDFSNLSFDNRKILFAKSQELLKTFMPDEIALVTGPNHFSCENDCVLGFKEAVSKVFPDFQQEKLTIVETPLELKRAMFEMMRRFGEDSQLPKCVIFSSDAVAEIFLEIQYFMMNETTVYSLSGDIWSVAKRACFPIKYIPRDAQRMGQVAAETLLRLVRNRKLEDSINEIIETRYPISAPEKMSRIVLTNKKPLKIMVLRSNAMDVMIRLSPNFTKQTGIPVEFIMKPFDELTHLLVGDAALFPDSDVLWVDIPLLDTLDRRGQIMDIRSMIEKDDKDILSAFSKNVRQSYFDGKSKIVGIPILVDEPFLYYRKDLFNNQAIQWNFYNKNGFELRPPKTWAEFNYISAFFTKSINPDSPTEFGTALSLTCPTGFMEEFYIRQWAFNGKMVDKEGNPNFDTIENAKALESLVTSYKYSPSNSLNSFYEETFGNLLIGNVAQLVGFPTHYLPFRHKELELNNETNIALAPIPGGKPLLGSWALCVNAQTQMPEEAYSFLTWVISEDIAVTKGLLGNLVPVNTTYRNTILSSNYPSLEMMNNIPLSKKVREVIKDPLGRVVDQYLFENAVANQLVRAMNGEQSVMKSVRNAQEAIEELMRY